jgi:hypothetical protein
LDLRSRISGINSPEPSARYIYALALAAANPGDTTSELADLGCYPTHAVQALTEQGAASEDAWPWNVGDITKRPDWAAIRDGDGQILKASGYEWLVTDRLNSIHRALTEGFPLALCLNFVDDAFENFEGPGVVSLPSGPNRGGHCVCAVGWRDDGAVRILNSWGTTWGDGGFAWLSPELVGSSYVDAACAIEVQS